MNPITPGRYRTRDGRVATVTSYGKGEFPILGTITSGAINSWNWMGRYWSDGESGLDLVSRLDDAPNPLIAPLEWALGQLEESLDPEWQAAYKAATEALKLAKGGSR